MIRRVVALFTKNNRKIHDTEISFSVVTPSFNQSMFLGKNLKSVREQTYKKVQHIIVDPGSTDGSREIAEKSGAQKLIFEADSGQSEGINKGFQKASGHILTWLNSDDFYASSDVLTRVAETFKENPNIDVVYGNVNFVDESGNFLKKGFVNKKEESLGESFEYQVGVVQPGVFIRKRVFESIGGPSESYDYCMDYEYWVRISKAGYKWKHMNLTIANHRWWSGMKTSANRGLSLIEHLKVCHQHFGYVHWKWIERLAEFESTGQDGIVNTDNDKNPVKKLEIERELIQRYINQQMVEEMSLQKDGEKRKSLKYFLSKYPELKRSYFSVNLDSFQSTSPIRERVPNSWTFTEKVNDDGVAFKGYALDGNFDKNFEAEWFDSSLEKSLQKLTDWSKERRSSTCVIVGNGPSLKLSSLTALEHTDVFLSNYAYLDPTLKNLGTFLTVTNHFVADQAALELNNIRIRKILPIWLGDIANLTDETAFVSATLEPKFAKTLDSVFSWRSTVSFFNMQLAYAMGYEKVVLIGFDHKYVQPKGTKEGSFISQVEDDDNHFAPTYFKGKIWQAADTSKMEEAYEVARTVYEAGGKRIVNCTIGGELEVFPRGILEKELRA